MKEHIAELAKTANDLEEIKFEGSDQTILENAVARIRNVMRSLERERFCAQPIGGAEKEKAD